MKTALRVLLLCCLIASTAVAQQKKGLQSELLDRLEGEWVLKGTIAGGETTHDIVAEWVLDHQYLRFHEVSREKADDGAPEYEAIVFIGWDQPSGRSACLWLDSTGGGGLVAKAIGHAKRNGDELPFVFDDGTSSAIHNTFKYNRDTDTWAWLIDNVKNGEPTPFARVSLRRR